MRQMHVLAVGPHQALLDSDLLGQPALGDQCIFRIGEGALNRLLVGQKGRFPGGCLFGQSRLGLGKLDLERFGVHLEKDLPRLYQGPLGVQPSVEETANPRLNVDPV